MSKMKNCLISKRQLLPKVGNTKPIVLSSKRYQKLLDNATNEEERRRIEEQSQEDEYVQYLKDGSDKLIESFGGENIRHEKEYGEASLIEKLAEERKNKKFLETLAAIRENEAQVRKEKVAKAQYMLDRLKPTSRKLESAAFQSEMLRARVFHANINSDYAKAAKLQEVVDTEKCNTQNMAILEDIKGQLEEQEKKKNDHKKYLFQLIEDNKKKRAEEKQKLLAEQLAEREQCQREIQKEIEKEKKKKRRQMEKVIAVALEAEKECADRKRMELVADEIDERIACVHRENKRKLEKIRNIQSAKYFQKRWARIDELVKQVAALPKKEDKEWERVLRDVEEKERLCIAKEKEQALREEEKLRARKEEHENAMLRLKHQAKCATEMKRYEMAQRIKHGETNCLREEQFKRQLEQKQIDMRCYLNSQIEHNRRVAEQRRAEIGPCHENVFEEQDRFFFRYARELMEHAYKEERPLFPFVKILDDYKKDNHITCHPRIPKHLVSNVNLQHAAPNDKQSSKTDLKIAKVQSKTSMPRCKLHNIERATPLQGGILEDCLKIEQLIAKEKIERKKPMPCNPFTCLHTQKKQEANKADGLQYCQSLICLNKQETNKKSSLQ